MGFDYYAVLGITRSATDYDIKMAFRKKAIHYNPERNNDPKSKPMFTLICEAYEVLSDKFTKAVYDQYGGDALKKGVVTPLGFVPPYEYDGDTHRTFQEFFGTDNPFADILNTYGPVKKAKTYRGKTRRDSQEVDKFIKQMITSGIDAKQRSDLDSKGVDKYIEQLITSGIDAKNEGVEKYVKDLITSGIEAKSQGVEKYIKDLITSGIEANSEGVENYIKQLLTSGIESKQRTDIEQMILAGIESTTQSKLADEKVEIVDLSLEEIYIGCLKLINVKVPEVDPCSDEFNIVSSSKTLYVKIKPGLPANTVFRFPREPQEFAPLSPEVLVVTRDKPHDVFWREGTDLHMNWSVPLKNALTGFSFEVKTLDDRILHIPVTDIGGCGGFTKIVNSEGMPLVEEPHKRGNLVIHLQVEFPKTLTLDQRKALGPLLDEDWGKNTTRQILDRKMQSRAGEMDI